MNIVSTAGVVVTALPYACTLSIQAVMVGALLGVALGSMVEHRYVGHIPSGFTRKGACACIISVVIMASIFAIGYLMPIIVSSISAAMVMVMAVAFVPYILKRCSDHVE